MAKTKTTFDPIFLDYWDRLKFRLSEAERAATHDEGEVMGLLLALTWPTTVKAYRD